MLKTGKYALLCLGILLGIMAMVSVTSGQTQDPSEPIKTLNFQAAEIRSVVRFLADYGNVNVVVAPAVQGNVTISLRDVTWKQALEIIGQTYDLAVVYEEAGYIRILPAADYRKEMTDMRKYQQEQTTLTNLDTKIIKISNSTSSSIVDAVQSLLSPRGKATADSRTNSIVLQEIPENIDKVIEYINKLDQPPKQIKISAQLLEVNSRTLSELGVNWNLNGYDGSVVPAPTADLFRGDDALAGQGAAAGSDVNRTRSAATQKTDYTGANAAGQFWVRTIQDSWDLEARISALVDDGKGKILAHPEITTIDNSEARIQMGQKVPIKQFDQSGNTVITFEEVGTLLKVTPHITSANKILMHLMPERSTYEFGQAGVIINTNNAETNVVVENGQTAVIGGLTTQDEIENHIGLPILKDIPLLGYLFSYRHKEITNRDLVIFVTPTIVDDYASVGTEKP
jgi:type IV pilus secretin PilQ/predicted competence protein